MKAPNAKTKAAVAGPRPSKMYDEDSPGFKRIVRGMTLTAIRKSINEPNAVVIVMLDADGNPVGEGSTTPVKPTTAEKAARRQRFVDAGLLGPFGSATERRYAHRRNHRVAAAGPAVKKSA